MFKVLFIILFSLFIFSCSDDLNVKEVFCVDDSKCPSDAICEKNKCVLKTDLKTCANDLECETNKLYCDDIIGKCRDNTCTGKESCKSNEYCFNNEICKEYCNNDDDCSDLGLTCSKDKECISIEDNCFPLCNKENQSCVKDSEDVNSDYHCKCIEGYEEDENNNCVITCIPSCDGKLCGGDDGCGNTCGECEEWERCNSDYSCEVDLGRCSSNDNCTDNPLKPICDLDGTSVTVHTCIESCIDITCETNTHCNPQNNECVSDWKEVSIGRQHTCAINMVNKLYCWGDNSSKQLGVENFSASYSYTPRFVGELGMEWKTVSAGFDHTCAINIDNKLYCWGEGEFGQLGLGELILDSSIPSQVGSSNWLSISSGSKYTCGIQNNESLYCWGKNTSGELGLGNDNQENSPIKVSQLNHVSVVEASINHTCAIIIETDIYEKTLYCWGDNSNFKLGKSFEASTNTPQEIDSSINWLNISLGENHTCGTTGTLSYCWGSNSHGQLGDDDTEIDTNRVFNSENNVKDIGYNDMSFNKIYSGTNYSCGIGGIDLFCWGNNSNSQFGKSDPIRTNYATPINMNTTSLSLNRFNVDFHACLIRDGQIYCWGSNEYGQLGTNTNSTESTPLLIKEP